ncbi:Mth938-like domain-containing protein [Thiohalorhabdus methylotrophus]|uniref:Mth938-like domain-containing protein n=1 Tax=Thiohalorhabdus methylotrophus TaxID=3242694 RepID=A0ABV4TZN3_9GAMM
MDFREIQTEGSYLIRGYAPGELRINEERFNESLMLFRESMWSGWLPERSGDLEAWHLEPLVDSGVEVLLIGTGDRLQFPEPRVTAPLVNNRIGVETMDTPAACRTYNLLMSEDRVVAAALFLTERAG